MGKGGTEMELAKDIRFTRVYHSIVAILLLLGGGALLGLGAWFTATNNGQPFDLENPNNNLYKTFMTLNKVALILGGFVMLSGVVSLIALKKGCLCHIFQAIGFIMAINIFIVLLALTARSILVLRNTGNSDFRTAFRSSWATTVQTNPEVICNIENAFSCRGFEDGDCAPCTGLDQNCEVKMRALCASCSDVPSTSESARPGCYSQITSLLDSFFLPLAIFSGILAFVQLLDIYFTCSL